MRFTIFGGATAALLAGATSAQTIIGHPAASENSVPSATVAALPDTVTLKAGTVVRIESKVALSSKLNRAGERFAISLADPLTQNGQLLIAAGIRGEGEIVHAAQARWGGKAGELIANARFLDCGSVRLPLGHLHWSKGGANRTGDAIAAGMIFTPAMFLVSGGEVEIPAGVSGDAKLTSDVEISRSALNCSAEPTASASALTAH